MFPELAVGVDPGGGVFEAFGFESAGAPLGVAAAGDEAGSFEDFEMFGDAGERHAEGRCDFGDGGVAVCQAFEDGSAGGVGECGEG